MTRKETAQFLRIALSTLDKLVRQKKLRPIRFNRRVLFREQDLVAFIEQHLGDDNGKVEN